MTAIALRHEWSTAAIFACDRQDYYAELRASGMTEDEAARHVWANEMQRFRNRDEYMGQVAA